MKKDIIEDMGINSMYQTVSGGQAGPWAAHNECPQWQPVTGVHNAADELVLPALCR